MVAERNWRKESYSLHRESTGIIFSTPFLFTVTDQFLVDDCPATAEEMEN
jgi:hypothetical protein